MRLLRKIAGGLRALFHKQKLERELDEELRAYAESAAAEKMKSGISREPALREVRLSLGSPEGLKENVRAVGWETLAETLWQDVRFAIRILAKTPVITAVALLSLALGIGANTAIFSLMDSVMLRSLPVQNPEELLHVGMHSPVAGNRFQSTFPNLVWEQVRDHQDVFSGAFAWFTQDFNLADGGEVQYANGSLVSGDYFATLGVRPAAGRLMTPADDQRGCSGAAVLGYGFWQQHYAGAESAIGSLLRIGGHSFPVIGVTQPNFFGVDVGYRFDVALPICAEAILNGKNSMLDRRSAWWLRIVGRLKPGVNSQQAAARLNVLAPQMFAATLPSDWDAKAQQNFLKRSFTTEPAGNGLSFLRDDYERPLETLLVVVGLVLLIACANIASLLLARAAARQKEIAVRLSLGASRGRLIRQVLTESIVLSVAGASLGILFARWGGPLLVRMVSTADQKVFLDLSMDTHVLVFTVGVALLTGLLFGILPAFRATRVSLTSAMKGENAEFAGGRSRFRSAQWIVATQVALSLILLIGTGLFIGSFRKLLTLDPGFDRSNVLLVNTDVHNTNSSPAARLAIYGQLLERLKAIPGVVSVSQNWFTPFSNYQWNQEISVEGYTPPPGVEPVVYFNWMTAGYFATLRTPFLAGRDFDGGDTAASPPVAVVNETMAREFFPNANPIGKYFLISESNIASKKPLQIIGLVRDSKYDSLREAVLPFAYVPLSQITEVREESTFEIRTPMSSSSLIPAVRDAMRSVSKAASLRFVTLSEQVDDSLNQERLLAMLSGFFGGLALLLTAIGLYGVMAYVVTRRQKEIGIRMALGAQPASILRLVMRNVTALLFAGIVAGLLGAWWTTRFVQQLLFELAPRDVRTIALAVILLAAVALLAGYLPARRAARLDPMRILREE
ncbi:MAG: ADOP family duplicated permease [Candidatus Acidiferrales bacterium]